ncbi:bifunctional UDP-N-acetylglucosamine diphosphorylase/glucosamine-1-phosphate N-acetyltransferase GlmU [Candidatus Liberibacter asiaticus]|uniref:Bifunctional protein GlmU n=2 Tax=Liberibacter asiaticus TaxID=34021 RepID=C6XGB2_LIBAP|nr:bifunctional UDP-N-acetylglucosamine diphosphorylase/glucosamine-1-phosphate N-acetyltransferase GlmU [Candidatus Liberibacter asiaticus]ACT57415.1 UDP-N-acetylglucosamine pyrophosphorylase protein [Candidatus Liberibacter asiaticus str. psy62]AGH17178.1 UDP-N-acetylglucosamine pyrophosphorylase protein [Candidatus Liberibacter asiaticus str. gxpsy]ALK07483.1 bifunctional UDP-N-acetylglucosamine diphosphorylase/glucosamine-1-phosphate N-acetyltransferase GlmU [Candidatus Liberibacter asiaticu
MKRKRLAIVLAAGRGHRMKSSSSKVLQKIAGKPMISHVMETIAAAGIENVALVLGYGAEEITRINFPPTLSVEYYIQDCQQGTAHAVLTAQDAIKPGYDDVIIMYGDVPLVSSHTLKKAMDKIAQGYSIAVVGFNADNPKGYGRLLIKNNEIIAIREENDATDEERKIHYCNSGLMAIDGLYIMDWLLQIKKNKVSQEYYLTDIIEKARLDGKSIASIDVKEQEVCGCNNRYELSLIENIWQSRYRRQMMISGVTMIAPETVFLSHDTIIQPDTVIEPHVFFGCGVSIENYVQIRAFSYLEGVHIGKKTIIGPFARIRQETTIEKNVRIGNFCEVKKATIKEGSKINHLSYVGDSVVGKNVNIGAGTITCNYDGTHKYKTHINENAFIGSNSSLIAPITIGQGTYVASGSIITQDTPENSLVFARSRQIVKEDGALSMRKKK